MANKTYIVGEMQMSAQNSLTELISLLNAMRLAMPFLGLTLNLFKGYEEINIFQHSPTFVKSPEDIICLHYKCENVFHDSYQSKFGEIHCTIAIVNQRQAIEGSKIYMIKHSNGRIFRKKDWTETLLYKLSSTSLKQACGIVLGHLSKEECFYPVIQFRQGRKTKQLKLCYDLFIIFNQNTLGGKTFPEHIEKKLLLNCLKTLKSRDKKHLLTNPELQDSYKYSEALQQFGETFGKMLRKRHPQQKFDQNLEEIIAHQTRLMFSKN